jgi:hypothetical protein
MKVAWANEPGFEEYFLSDAIQAELGIGCHEAPHLSRRSNLIQYQIDIHDDCFFTIEPIELDLLKKLVHQILQQHSFYLGVEVDWSDILDLITEQVKTSTQIAMQSNPKLQCLSVWQEPDQSFIQRLLKPIKPCKVIIQEKKASFAIAL